MTKPILAFCLILVCALAAPAEDQVHIPIPYTGHRWYSGYLTFATGKFHYVYFDSQKDPDNDPIVLWLNGGPGCSSLIGMVYENGPFVFKENTTNFEVNPYAWNIKANLLYLQSPGGVGFSEDKRNLKNDDGTVAEDNYRALLQFYKKFPNLKKNQLYLSGESYAGIYVPYLAHKILQMNDLPETDLKMNLKGVLIGNACTDPRECYEPGNDIDLGIYQYEFLYNHNYLTQKQWDNIQAACILGYHSSYCSEVRKPIDQFFYASKTSMLNIYAKCLNQKVFAPEGKQFVRSVSGKRIAVGFGQEAISCEDQLGIHEFFNTATIQKQLHTAFVKYQQCSDDVAIKYTMFANASYWIYPLLFKAKLRVWIYEGDVDCSVPITGTTRWIIHLKEENGLAVEEPWREWWVKGAHKHEDQVAGMTWKLRGFTFASVRGAGHLVPKDKRKQAYVLLQSFLGGNDLPYKSE